MLDPARLVRGLAEAVERLGATLYEATVVDEIPPWGRVQASRASCERLLGEGDVVVRATEAWTSTLPGERRALLPVYSLMIATEPLPGSFWAGTGWPGASPSQTTGV